MRNITVFILVVLAIVAIVAREVEPHKCWNDVARAHGIRVVRPTLRIAYDTTHHPSLWVGGSKVFCVQKCDRPEDAHSANPATYRVFHTAIAANLGADDVVPTLRAFTSFVGFDVADPRLAVVFVEEFRALFEPCGILRVVHRQHTRNLVEAYECGDGSGWFRCRLRGQRGGLPTVSLHMYVGDGPVQSTPLDATRWVELGELGRNPTGFSLAMGVERMQFAAGVRHDHRTPHHVLPPR